MSSSDWLDLSEAAHFLGIHYTTLRRWADSGRLPLSRTPGGRRRFLRADLEQFQAGQRVPGPLSHPASTNQTEEQTNQMLRRQIHQVAHHQQAWMERLGDIQRMKFKYSGQLLLGLLMQYNSRSQGGEVYLQEAERLSQDYGRVCSQAGLSITETARIFLFFQHSITDLIIDTSSLNEAHSAEEKRLYRRTYAFFDALLLAVLDGYSRAAQSHPLTGTDHAAHPSPEL